MKSFLAIITGVLLLFVGLTIYNFNQQIYGYGYDQGFTIGYNKNKNGCDIIAYSKKGDFFNNHYLEGYRKGMYDAIEETSK